MTVSARWRVACHLAPRRARARGGGARKMSDYKVQEPRPGYFRIQRKDPITGKTQSFTGRDKAQLIARVAQFESLRKDLEAGIVTADEVIERRERLVHGVYTVRQAWEAYFPGLSSTTARAAKAAWTTRLEGPFAELPCCEVTEDKLKAWYEIERRSNIHPKTIANAWDCLRSALRLAIRTRRLDREPWAEFRIKIPKTKTVKKELCRDIEEVRRLIAECARHDEEQAKKTHGPCFPDLARKYIVAVYLGLRNGELGALGWDDLQLRSGVPHVIVRHTVNRDWKSEHPEWERPLAPPKNREEVALPLHPEVLRVLMVQKRALKALGHYRDDGPIFPGNGGAWRLHPRTLDPILMKKLVRRALPGVDASKFTPHSLRHTFATLTTVALGGDVKRAQRLTRHADVRQLEQYLHEAGRTETNPLPPLDKRGDADAIVEAQRDRALQRAMTRAPELMPPQVEANEDTPVLVGIDPEEALMVLQERGGAEPAGLLANASIELATAEAGRAAVDVKRERRRANLRAAKEKFTGRRMADFLDAYRVWNASGRPGARPQAVTVAAERAYQRKYGKVLRAKEPGAFKVQRGQTSWERVARVALRLRSDEPTPLGAVAALMKVNGGRPLPAPGNYVKTPVEWRARNEGNLARRGALGAWYGLLKRIEAGENVEIDTNEAADLDEDDDADAAE